MVGSAPLVFKLMEQCVCVMAPRGTVARRTRWAQVAMDR